MDASGEASSRLAEEIRHELVQSSQQLSEMQGLDEAARAKMTALLAELIELLETGSTQEQVAHVGEMSHRLKGLIDRAAGLNGEPEGAIELLEQAAAQAETEAPLLTGTVRRLMEILSDIGI